MTTPALTAESEALLLEVTETAEKAKVGMAGQVFVIRGRPMLDGAEVVISGEQMLEVLAAAVARHVRETGCERLTVDRLAAAAQSVATDLYGHAPESAWWREYAARILAALAPIPATEEVERG